MTIKGRTNSERWHRVGGRLDPEVHGVRSYPSAPLPQPKDEPPQMWDVLVGRIGAAERELSLTYGGELEIALHGWYTDSVRLNDRQIAFLRDTLNAWFPPE